MKQRLALSATLLLGATLSLGASLLAGCAYDPDATPRAEARSQRPAPAPGSVVVHLNGEANVSASKSN